MTPIRNETRVRLSHSQIPKKHPDRSPWALLAPVPVDRGCFLYARARRSTQYEDKNCQIWYNFREKFGLMPEVLRIASSSLMGEQRKKSPAEPWGVQTPKRNHNASYSSSKTGKLNGRYANTSLSSQVNANNTLSMPSISLGFSIKILQM